MRKIDLMKVVSNLETYPTWSTGKSYKLDVQEFSDKILIKGKNASSFEFPRYIFLSPDIFWLIGFLDGEGSKSKGKSGYLRFTITNSNPYMIKMALDILDKHGVLTKTKIPDRGIRIRRSSKHNDKKLLNFWMNHLRLPKSKFYFSPKPDETKKAKHGVCHIYTSNMILRRVIDRLIEYVKDNYIKASQLNIERFSGVEQPGD